MTPFVVVEIVPVAVEQLSGANSNHVLPPLASASVEGSSGTWSLSDSDQIDAKTDP